MNSAHSSCRGSLSISGNTHENINNIASLWVLSYIKAKKSKLICMMLCCKRPFLFSVLLNQSAFDLGCTVFLCLSFFLLLLTIFMLCLVFFLLCMCRSLASVSDFSQLRSRSQSQEGDEHLGEVVEEEEAGGGGGEEGRRVSKEGRLQGERKGSMERVDTDKEHQEDLVETEDDLHQRSISETDLR